VRLLPTNGQVGIRALQLGEDCGTGRFCETIDFVGEEVEVF
jgi:hypothetical protein